MNARLLAAALLMVQAAPARVQVAPAAQVVRSLIPGGSIRDVLAGGERAVFSIDGRLRPRRVSWCGRRASTSR